MIQRREESDQSSGVPIFMVMRMVVFIVTTCSLELPAETQMYWIRTGMLVMLVCRCENFCAMNLEHMFSAGLCTASCVVFTFCVVLLDHWWNFRTIFVYMLHPVVFLLTSLKLSWLVINFIVISANYMHVFTFPQSVGTSHIIKAILWHRWAMTATSSMIAGYHFGWLLFSHWSVWLFELRTFMM